MKISIVAGAVLVLALSTACAPKPPAPPDANAIKAAIEAQEAKFLPVMSKKDVAGLVAMFTKDAVWIENDAATFTGTAEIEKGAKGLFDAFDSITPGTTTLDRLVVVSDSEAVTFSHLTYSMTLKGKKTAENRINPFADHWKKESDSVWRISYEINADGVVPQAPAKK